jgi:asparagine synthase (glutamine-hydrolysing)
MCSISGIIKHGCVGTQLSKLEDNVSQMNAALRHRGPDDQGITTDECSTGPDSSIQLCLGNTRLAIIDTSAAGHQPMVDEQTGIAITYNGETYNFRDLKKEIGDDFGPWRSTSDTEVVLRAYRKWGIDAFKRMRGMFACAIWDPRKRDLILVRDRFGIKPLYYFVGSNEIPGRASLLAFASELRALLATKLVERRLSREGVASYLSYGSTQSPLTIVEGVKALEPGECLIIHADQAGLKLQSASIDTEVQLSTNGFRTRRDAAMRLREALEESVRVHLVSDVPLGVFLSGGMDSSAIVALMSRVSSERPKTFSVVFDDKKLSESHHAQIVADKFQTAHQEILLEEHELLRLLPDAIRSFDQPSMDGVNTYVVAKAVKQAGITVALSGLGGDELFAGYPSFRRSLRIQSMPLTLKRVLRRTFAGRTFGANGSVRRNKLKQLMKSNGSPDDVYRITRQLFDPEAVNLLSHSSFEQHAKCHDHFSDPVNEICVLEMQGYMANTLLRDTDSMSMTHSLEVRVPFIDIDVVRFALSVPGKLKLNGGSERVSKPLLADAISDLLPPDLMSRRKMGFTLPFESWMQAGLLSDISAVLLDADRLHTIGLDEIAVAKVWNQFLKAPRAVGWSRPWSLYVLAKWCEVNRVTA